MGKHTIVLLQPGNKSTRTYLDYDTIEQAMDGICGLFEADLKRQHPRSGQITYDISDLYRYLDSFSDITCLVLENNMYSPCPKAWVKDRILHHLKRQVGGR